MSAHHSRRAVERQPRINFLTDPTTSRDLFGIVRGKCTSVCSPEIPVFHPMETGRVEPPQPGTACSPAGVLAHLQCDRCGRYLKDTSAYTVKIGEQVCVVIVNLLLAFCTSFGLIYCNLRVSIQRYAWRVRRVTENPFSLGWHLAGPRPP